ncbi:MAG: UDP-N-acetylmuramoyl-L-alanine--D-glutamate ligase [Alphaproteobacteria bacterium]|nr:UDP-N-acetylmuramoyl-L-alanine--D-glutamate ligase [Alphaproteobacteria bacterium]
MIRLPRYKNASVGVFGLGTAGQAAIASLLQSDAKVYAWDDNANSCAQLAESKAKNLTVKNFTQWPWQEMDCVILSPGVPLTHPQPHEVVRLAQKNAVRLVGEVDILYEARPDARYVGITGTNGKSTTTALIGHVLQENGLSAQVGANLGVPALALTTTGAEDIYVLEMSSYQLDLMHTTRFNVAVLLNITPDHLDRHGDMAGYIAAKQRIFQHQKSEDAAFIGVDDAYSCKLYDAIRQRNTQHVTPLSITQTNNTAIHVDSNGVLHDPTTTPVFRYDLTQLQRLKGAHNWQNIAAAYGVARYFAIDSNAIMRTIYNFSGLPHRLELVAQLGNVQFINDSKATNAEAAARALAPFDNIYWLVGGRAKAGGIDALAPYFNKITHAYLMGEAEDSFAQSLEGKVAYTKCGTLKNALHMANEAAQDNKKETVVLLSPACASFDQWKSFEARGDAFRDQVMELASKGVSSCA